MTIGLTGTDLRKKFKTTYDEELAIKQFHYESLRGVYEVYNPEVGL